MKTVADVMTPAPIVAQVPGSRNEVINMMVRNKLTGLPVVRASDGKLMGIVSRRDIFKKFEETQLSLIMKKNIITISPYAPLPEAARIFAEKRIHRIPVVDENKLVGIITPTDILKEIRNMKTAMTAEDVINTTCVTAYEEDPISYAVAAMRVSDVAALCILNAKGDLSGILTDRDMFNDQVSDEEAAAKLGVSDTKLIGLRNVLPLFYTATSDYFDNNKQIKDYMVPKPLTVFRKTTLNEVARLMISNDFGQIPVRGTKDELIGMIYDVDVLRAVTGVLE
ncbi:MAG: CBS domain-containing protein [Candidatus Methanomethylophilus sp.]|jgi:CBS domain-containing protein|nr:CBS domain-containing protein [Methanomethylophilus sp.]MEE3363974.1 CBS domain-containing protein [Methanomethylophilus sp.]MEE3478363.1 CBS domain-containing protein [Methanomethylophilus sp.]